MGFNFRVSARLESRKDASSSGAGGSGIGAVNAKKSTGGMTAGQQQRNSHQTATGRPQRPLPSRSSTRGRQADANAKAGSSNAEGTSRTRTLSKPTKPSTLVAKPAFQPTVPVSPEFATELRLKERHKFDEMIKEKERREQAEREARRKLEEEEEEKRIKELRKKAVPKAHEVPEWYNDMPKKQK